MATTTDNINIKINVDASKSEQSTVNYKAKIRELKEEMVQLQVETNGLADATAEQRARYDELQKQAGQLQDALSDVSARIRANADDYQHFGAVLEGLGAATSVVQGLAGQISLLGGESQSTERLAKSFMALQGQLNAINNVQKVFNKDSKLMISLQSTLSNAIKEGGDSAKAATIAQKGLNAAMKAAPYIAIASALITVVGAIADFVKGTNEARDSQDELGASVRQTNEELRAQQILMKADADDVTTTMETLIRMAKEAGGNVTKLNSIFASFTDRTGFAVKSVQEMEWAFRLQNNVINKNTKTMEEAANANSAYREQLKELAKQEVRLQEDLSQLTEGSESYNLTLSELQETQSRIFRIQEAIKNNTKASVEAEQQNKNVVAEFNAESEKRNKTEEKTVTTVKKRNAITEEQIKLLKILDLREGTNYAQKIKYEDQIKSSLQEKMVKLADELEHQKVYAQELGKIADEKKALDNDELDSIGKINAKYDERIEEVKKLGLTEQQVAQLVILINKNRDAELEKENEKLGKERQRRAIDAQNNIDDAVLATRLANLKEGSEEYWELQEEIEAERYEQEMEELRRKLEDKQITQDEYDAIAEQKEAEHQQRIRDIEKETVAARIEGYAQYADNVQNILGSMSNFVMALQDAELANAEGDEKKQKEIKKKYAVANMMMTIGQIAVETVMGATSALANAIRDLGFPAGPIVGGVMAALVTATGIANVAKAVAEKNKIMKAKRGAYVVGPSHAEGGVPYELEGGEAVLNKRAMSIPAYRNMASAMNVATGGVAFPGTNPNMGMTAMVDERAVDVIVRRTIAGITSIPVVVSEESITNAQRNVGVSVERSRI